MFERFKQKTIVIEKKFEIPASVVSHINSAKDGNESKDRFVEYLKGLDRVDFLRVKDLWPKFWGPKNSLYDWMYEAYSDVEWKIDWPQNEALYDLFKDQVYENMPIIYVKQKDKNGREQELNLNDLVNKVNGIQKKLDKALVLISNAEFKLSGKEAMKL